MQSPVAQGATLPAAHAQLIDQLARWGRLLHAYKTSAAGTSHGDRSSHVLLFPLHHDGPMRAGSLAERVHADPSTVSRQTAELVRDGLVRREADPEDGRASLLAITERGQEVVQELRGARLRVLEDVLGDWNEDDVATFTQLFTRFNDGLQQLSTTSGLPAQASRTTTIEESR